MWARDSSWLAGWLPDDTLVAWLLPWPLDHMQIDRRSMRHPWYPETPTCTSYSYIVALLCTRTSYDVHRYYVPCTCTTSYPRQCTYVHSTIIVRCCTLYDVHRCTCRYYVCMYMYDVLCTSVLEPPLPARATTGSCGLYTVTRAVHAGYSSTRLAVPCTLTMYCTMYLVRCTMYLVRGTR